MKKLPMILLLIAPYVILILCNQINMELTTGLYGYGALILFNGIYAFLLPRLGCSGKQILIWNLLLKLFNLPVIVLIQLVTLVSALFGGENMRGDLPAILGIALLACYVLQLSSAVFGISGFRWCRKHGTLSQAGVVASSIVQLLPCIDVIGSILCYIMFRKEGQPKD